MAAPPAFSCALAAVDYAFPWSTLITEFKSQGGVELAGALATLLAARVQPQAAAVDLVLPMPSSDERLARRGYNPAWELARRVAHAMRIDTSAHMLQRPFDGVAQRGHDRATRSRNVQGAFTVNQRHLGALRGARVAIVDDVMTTCATANEAARSLLAAGVANVQVWVVARTPAPLQP